SSAAGVPALRRRSPTRRSSDLGRFGRGRCWGRSGGASWAPHPLPAGNLPPVLFAIGELDNNTNYLGQLHVAEQIPSARVLWHGDSHLTKTYGSTCAVSDLSFHVKPGQVTGFLGHNGSGKSTTMRMILGLHRPDSGRALINGVPKRDLPHPMREVGAMLDAAEVQGGRSAFDHLRALAYAGGLPRRRVAQVLEEVGLAGAAGKRIAGFSQGMRQRLGIAAALLGDPGVLILDEPVNGLDPDGIRWLRGLLRSLAAEGRTVLLSSHLMTEMSLTADRLIIIAHGRLIEETTTPEFLARFRSDVLVRSPHPARLAEVLQAAGA